MVQCFLLSGVSVDLRLSEAGGLLQAKRDYDPSPRKGEQLKSDLNNWLLSRMTSGSLRVFSRD